MANDSFDGTRLDDRGKRELTEDKGGHELPVFQEGACIDKDGRYEYVRELGSGGMGKVFLVKDKDACDKLMAVKTVNVKPEKREEWEKAVEDLKREFSKQQDLVHEGIAMARNIVHNEFHWYLVMDYAEGITLKDYMSRHGGPLDIPVVLEIVKRLADALDYVHLKKIVHCDVKPSNIMVDIDGGKVKSVKLIDFGLSKRMRENYNYFELFLDVAPAVAGGNIEKTGESEDGVGGTAYYMSPEQWRRWQTPDAEEVSYESDQYSLAAVAYEMLSGSCPYKEEFEKNEKEDDKNNGDARRNTICRIVLDKAMRLEPIKGVPKRMNNALRKALSKNPEGRFESCTKLMDAMVPKKWSKREKWFVFAGCLELLAFIALFIYAVKGGVGSQFSSDSDGTGGDKLLLDFGGGVTLKLMPIGYHFHFPTEAQLKYVSSDGDKFSIYDEYEKKKKEWPR
jgi:serine/threonine protein kinase